MEIKRERIPEEGRIAGERITAEERIESGGIAAKAKKTAAEERIADRQASQAVKIAQIQADTQAKQTESFT